MANLLAYIEQITVCPALRGNFAFENRIVSLPQSSPATTLTWPDSESPSHLAPPPPTFQLSVADLAPLVRHGHHALLDLLARRDIVVRVADLQIDARLEGRIDGAHVIGRPS